MTLRCSLILLLCGAVMLVGWGWPARADNIHATYVQKKGPAEAIVVGANPDADHVEVNLSGMVSITLRVEGSTTLEVEKPDAVSASDRWKEWRREPPHEKQLGDNKVWEQHFVLEPLRPGDQMLLLAPLRYRQDASDSWQTIAWDPIPVEVTTEIKQADAKELREITPPEPASSPEPGFPWLLWTGASVIVLVLIVGIWEVAHRYGRVKPAAPPEEWAMSELDRIRTKDLPAKGDGVEHHALVAGVLRHYLELRFQLQSPGKTTTEFIDAIQQGAHLNPQQMTLLCEALDRCDLAKFAHIVPTPDECLGLERHVETLVRQTTRRE